MRINKHDTQGTKPLLGKGELGYDDYVAGGDVGRVYVGTGSENIALAERLESNMMTKAQFNALAEERKANRAGSGFENFGKGSSTTSVNVNEGIWTDSTQANKFYLGKTTSNSGTSITPHSETMVNGILQKLKNLNNSSLALAEILLPTAPNIYPHDTVLAAEQIASGVIKHADASNSGLIVNGKFDSGTSGWTKLGDGTTVVSGGSIELTSVSNNTGIQQSFTTVIGKQYIVNMNITTNKAFVGVSDNSDGIFLNSSISVNYSGMVLFSFTAITTTSYLIVKDAVSTSGTTIVDNIAVYPADAISRSDLVFLESWHEDISEKNFVYPLGNVQYLGSNTDGLTGITNGNFTGFETYSLFGNWQTPSVLIGKGYIWSNLTEAQKRAFIANPENNCYLDGDKTIQVRYRVIVLMGEDSNSMARATVQGKAVVPSTVIFTAPNTTVDAGLYSNTSTTYTYTGTSTNAISIANISRRNQGMYHPVYNANGTKKASDGNFWYNTAVSFTSISDCFDPAKLLTASGYIGSVSGRPDGLFYDQVHEGDITDLRNSSKKVEDYNRLIGREFNKLVVGSVRGKEGESDIVMIRTFTKTSTFGQDNNRFYFGISSAIYPQQSFSPIENNSYYLLGSNGSVYSANQVINQSATGTLYVPFGTTHVYIPIDGKNTAASMNTLFPDGTTITVIVVKRTTRTKSNTLLHCDIIGNPTNYPTEWKQSGVFGTPLIVAEDGTSLLPDGVRDTFKLSRKANATPLLCLRSTDSGVTWASFTPTFSTTTNEITLTNEPAGNLVMVYYQTHTSMAVPAVNSEVLEIGEVFSTNHNESQHGQYLCSTLLRKVPVFYGKSQGYPLENYELFGKVLWDNSARAPIHKALTYNQFGTSNPAIKVLPYLTRINGKAYLNLVYKELKHNGTTWGDDSKLLVPNYVSTTTDNNAQTVLIGQKTVELPYFIGADE